MVGLPEAPFLTGITQPRISRSAASASGVIGSRAFISRIVAQDAHRVCTVGPPKLNTSDSQSAQTNSCTTKVASSLRKHQAIGFLVRIGRFARRDDLRRHRVGPESLGALGVAIELVAELVEVAAHERLVVRHRQRDLMERRHPAVPAEEVDALELTDEDLALDLGRVLLQVFLDDAVEQVADLSEGGWTLDLDGFALTDQPIGRRAEPAVVGDDEPALFELDALDLLKVSDGEGFVLLAGRDPFDVPDLVVLRFAQQSLGDQPVLVLARLRRGLATGGDDLVEVRRRRDAEAHAIPGRAALFDHDVLHSGLQYSPLSVSKAFGLGVVASSMSRPTSALTLAINPVSSPIANAVSARMSLSSPLKIGSSASNATCSCLWTSGAVISSPFGLSPAAP